MKKIAADFHLKLVNVSQRNIDKYSEKYDIPKEHFTNNAYMVENEDIVMGIYDDPEIKMAAFFHEIGHTLISRNFELLVNEDEYFTEYQAWVEGLKVARKYKYRFSDKTFIYILTSLNSYYKDALKVYKKNEKNAAKNRI